MPDLEPITREEMLLDGQDLEPITRKEMFIKRIYDKTQVIPEPITREEMFLKKAGDETTDVTIEQLNVSANGTYSEEGKAYSPVIVNVPVPPIPDNAYLLNEVEGLPSDIATFTDGSNLPMPSLKVGIEPIQEGSGDPSPTNIRPISGWDEVNVTRCGKNLCPTAIADNVVYKNGEYAINLSFNDGIITFETTANISTYFLLKAFTITKQHIGKTFTMSYSATPSLDDNQCILVLNNNGTRTNLDKSATITADMVGKELTMRFYKYGIGTYTISNVQLELGSTATTYEPYNGQTYTIDLDGTRYGGKLDVVSGVLTVDRQIVDLGTLNWVASSDGRSRFYATVPSPYYKMTTDAKFICSQYIDDGIGSSTREYFGDNGTVRHNYTSNPSPSAYEIYIHDDRFGTDATAFKQAMNGVQLVYELATPLTIQLTPTQVKSLRGSNNVWCDTGKIEELEYFSKEV